MAGNRGSAEGDTGDGLACALRDFTILKKEQLTRQDSAVRSTQAGAWEGFILAGSQKHLCEGLRS